MSTSAASTIQCTATVELLEGRHIVRLPGDASDALPSRGQVAIEGSLDGKAFQTVVEPDGRRGHWIDLDDLGHAAKGIGAGTNVRLTMSPASEWPEPVVPDDLRAALDDAADLAELWDEITPMARWEWVRWVGATRNPDTRAKRVEVSISKMRDGKRRPCCFDLSSCTVAELARSGKLMEPTG
jgi:hypothetical protein